MTYEIEIERWHPTRLNELLGLPWSRARRKHRDADMVAGYCLQRHVTRATGKRRVSLTIGLGPRERGGDPDCYWKSLLDALVKCGALVDDSAKWVDLGAVEYVREKPRRKFARITLVDVE